MTINLSMPKSQSELRPSILVVGVGGAGGNAVNNMIRSNLEGVDFVVCNTDAQSLEQSLSERKIQLGLGTTEGLGAGSRPEIGAAAAEEALDEIQHHLNGTHMVFIAAGMGGGTGTGGAPIIARAAREQGILTVGVVTKPFQFEGGRRMKIAEEGIEELQQYVDTLIIIPNQNLFRIANEKTTFADAFKMADDVLYSGVRGVTDLMVMPGLINLDFADIRTVMSEMGKAMMGTGEADGDKRAVEAAERAISNPLLDDVTMQGAKGVLINITGGPDMTLFEVDEAANRIREEVDQEANIIFGSTFEEVLEGSIRVSVVATGIEAIANTEQRPMPIGLTTVVSNRAAAPVQDEPEIEAVPEVAEAALPIEEPVATDADETETAEAELADTEASEEESVAEAAEPKPTVPQRPAFIPPRPVRPGDMRRETKPAEPFAAAAMENARSEPAAPRRKALTLFERMTGTGRARPQSEPTPPQKPVEPTQKAEMPTPVRRQPPAAEPEQVGQPQLGGLESTDRSSQTPAEEEMLEIPAFLRRQAN
ncbi:MAG: cell division protein FtsZ [Alphaproteobacteria bacterium]|nr:cell division protein FtsZ [Alphaproteobacteria bacterium]